MLSFEEAKYLFNYNEHTGIVTWQVRKANCINVGDSTGAYDSSGYLRVYVNYKTYAAHRIAWLLMTGKWPTEQIDHINGIRDDNRWANLREASSHENAKNQAIPRNNTSGVVGVSFYPPLGKYAAYIRVNGKKKHLGYFHTIKEAEQSRKKASNEHGYHENHGRNPCR